MMVTFISQCEKKSLIRTRRVLDAFADRIGDNTWQTVITQEGLLAVKKLLRKSASKNTAVSCHWIRSRSRSELVWVVGNKDKFDPQGRVPVNSTQVQRTYRDDLADWHYLPLIQSLASLAALLHDWGKASARFQQKLAPDYRGPAADALRHEWISCLLLKALINQCPSESDDGWLTRLANGDIDEQALRQTDLCCLTAPLSELPPIAQLVAWLIVTHHRMPLPREPYAQLSNDWAGEAADKLEQVLGSINRDWGYWNENVRDTFKDCLTFPQGLVTNSTPWIKTIKRWAGKLLQQQTNIDRIMEDGSYRLILHHARLCLMLGDHYFSSLTPDKTGVWNNTTGMIANTQKDGQPKQALDQHLLGVYKQAKHNASRLPQLERGLPVTDNTTALKKSSGGNYKWQDTAARKIREWTTQHKHLKHGFFAVNMASTGSGKTFANAKIMLALSDDNASLRYILALGLRTLTLQTGDEYRQRIFQNSDGSDLAVLIGSKAIADLHSDAQQPDTNYADDSERGSESQQSLLDKDQQIDYDGGIPEDGLDTVLPNAKSRQLLYAPILTCTIDHIMAATETTRGGRYILPCLRLMSSDLVIDEVDDFTGADAIAIGRLIHLAGMLGRKVMISSATIPPSLAEGYFQCYRQGWQLFAQTRNASATVGCAWIDEFNTHVQDNDGQQNTLACQQYAQAHDVFIQKRIHELNLRPVRRKADIIKIASLPNQQDDAKQIAYFNHIIQAVENKHHHHCQADPDTGINVSFGVIRMANITPCIELTRYLLDYQTTAGIEFRVMAYHSQQVLLLRHEQERHLDAVLKRKEPTGEPPVAFHNPVIRSHLNALASQPHPPQHLLFILVATPVEEVGRDHDFDWAIVEPSSYRSIVQLAGRVMRHREYDVQHPNVGILQYNWKTIERGEKAYACYFTHPGYEFKGKILSNGKLRCASCATHDLSTLINESVVTERLDAIPRITETPLAGFGLARLEHLVTAHWLKNYEAKGPETLQGYVNQHWYLTALPQALNRFRQSRPSIHLYRCFDHRQNSYFTTRDEQGEAVYTTHGELANQDDFYRITALSLSASAQQRLWLVRDYHASLQHQSTRRDISLNSASLTYGEVVIQEPYENTESPDYSYNDQLGLFKVKRR
ncbi:type I-F CRISPR-associated helicase Cas3f [Gynuella sp.]|uniref:type I-F CRISPR-associated helicase Cas3f n=1 Tax=Gynuella sp. TaxID=2969146 RepID=UPI003D0A5291